MSLRSGLGAVLVWFRAMSSSTSALAAAAALTAPSAVAPRAWYLRNNGIAFPEAEFRATEVTLPHGKPGPPRESPGNAAIVADVLREVRTFIAGLR